MEHARRRERESFHMSRHHSELHNMFLAAYIGGLVYLLLCLILCAGVRLARVFGLKLSLGDWRIPL